ncbi:MAG: iron-sulfur cluster repair di-iron protein [Ignavibacteriaceae bacterium]|jgi:regulator of cell morphogenesis and NO signaling
METNNNFTTEQGLYGELTLSQIVSKNFRAAGIFEKYSLDFCCRGNKSLSDACIEKNLIEEEILTELQNTEISSYSSFLRTAGWELDFLVDYIINNHHNYVRNSIPSILTHAEKVAMKHGENHPETIEIHSIFLRVSKDLKQHLMKEEEILFPFIKYLVKTEKQKLKTERPYFGTLSNPINMMEAEHIIAGDSMSQIRKLTNNFNPPEEVCTTFKTYFNELKEFEEDLHQHVHLENYLLFPRAIELQEKAFS